MYLITGNDLITLRFARAAEHGRALIAETQTFLKRKPYSLITEHNADRSEYKLRFRVREEPPDQLAFILSDAAHQFRATLDNIAYILAGRPRGKLARRVQFPIIHPGRNGGRKAFDAWSRSRLARVASEPLAIIEKVQPYHGLGAPLPKFRPFPPHPLSVLEHLSNLDKHRAPHLTFIAPSHFQITANADPISREFTRGPLQDGAVVAVYTFGEPNVKVHSPSVRVMLALELAPYLKKGALPLVEYIGAILNIIGPRIIVPLRPYLD